MTHHLLRLAVLLFVAFVCGAQEFVAGKVVSVKDGGIRLNGIDASEVYYANRLEASPRTLRVLTRQHVCEGPQQLFLAARRMKGAS